MTATRCRRLLLAVLLAGLLAVSGCTTVDTAKLPVSPIVETFDTYEELCDAIGYDMLRIGGGFEPVAYSSIDGVLGQIEYVHGDIDLILREEPGDEGDITGVGQVSYAVSDVNGVDLHIGFFKDIQAAWLMSGDHSYSLTATGMDLDAFSDMAEQLAHAVTDV